ncbi:MAG: ABC transporter substrate-binding protein, partial [Aggregatilineales bacterium]
MKVLQGFMGVFISLLMVLVVVAQDEDTRNFEGKKVLLIDSYHAGYEWSDGTEAGLRSILDNTGIELRVIYMDTKRNTEIEFRENAALEARAEIEAFAPDVVIVAEDNAQEYLVVPYLLGIDLPVVFTGVNWDASTYGYPATNVTGIVEVELVQQLIEHLQQYTQGDKIGYLAVTSSTEVKAVEIYQERFFNGELQVHFVETFEEYKTAFVALQDEVDILFLGNNAGIDYWDEEAA